MLLESKIVTKYFLCFLLKFGEFRFYGNEINIWNYLEEVIEKRVTELRFISLFLKWFSKKQIIDILFGNDIITFSYNMDIRAFLFDFVINKYKKGLREILEYGLIYRIKMTESKIYIFPYQETKRDFFKNKSMKMDNLNRYRRCKSCEKIFNKNNCENGKCSNCNNLFYIKCNFFPDGDLEECKKCDFIYKENPYYHYCGLDGNKCIECHDICQKGTMKDCCLSSSGTKICKECYQKRYENCYGVSYW